MKYMTLKFSEEAITLELLLILENAAISKLLPTLGERFFLLKKLEQLKNIQIYEEKENILPVLDGTLNISNLPSQGSDQIPAVVSF